MAGTGDEGQPAVAVSTAVAVGTAVAVSTAVAVGTDHVIVVVEDLEAAAATWRALGFTLKPGRSHDNGIRNWHAKFPDGTEIELLTAPEARDPLTTTYRRHLGSGGDGPAFAGLFAPDRPALLARLRAAGTEPVEDGLVTFPDGPLRPLFFGRRNHSPTDLPEHFDHANGAIRLAGIWLAPDDPGRVRAVLEALGAEAVDQDFRPLGGGAQTTFLRLPEGFVALFADPAVRRSDRPVVGATVLVRDLDAAIRAIGPTPAGRRLSGPGGRSLVLPAQQTHGLFLELREPC